MILTVNAPSHSYPIYIGANLVDLLQQYAEKHTAKDCMIVTNETIAPLYLQQVANVFRQPAKLCILLFFLTAKRIKIWLRSI